MSYFSHLCVGSKPSSRSEPPFCQPWELPDNFSLNYDCISISTKKQDTLMNSKAFKSDYPTRHIALFSINLLTISHEELFELLQSCGEIRTLHPFFTEGVTIISYYKYSDAIKALSIIKDGFSHSYKACFAKPCLELASQIGAIHSFSEACASSNVQLVNLEYDDERKTEKLFARLNGVSIEGTTIKVLPASNNLFDCTCSEDVFSKLKEPPTCNKKPVNWSIMSALNLSENHTYFSKDLFSGLPLSVEDPLVSGHSSSSSSNCNRKNPGSKPYVSSSDYPSFPEVSDKTTGPCKEEPNSSNPPSSCLTAVSDVMSSKTDAKSPETTMNVDSASSLKISATTNTVLVSPNDVTTKDKKGPSGSTGCNKNKSYSSVVSAGVKTKVKPSLPLVPSASSAPSAPSAPGKASFELDISKVITKQDTRTTFMIRNIPNKYTQEMIMNLINETHKNSYDFFYLRMDFKNKCNMGYAFINFLDAKSAISLHQERGGKRWSKFNSDKRFQLSYAAIQGKKALIKKFQNSEVMEQELNYRPKLFYSSGASKGKEQPFPRPTGDGHKAKSSTRRR
ncbi:RNA recognition motif 2-domain-containing protein [Mucor mucedo]|uniref:RNA recognition motif 2-domain-containing protein n=1 Tax=Mucor mucedo TaxID=29922 RepID=UPI00221E686B|nr:RNA recognition motif 2-domain-containing protein [Mucor mucedo]KAI7891548.1 RNA recognition motif 2-domain-containing protein [Mucor mucedo]